MVTRRKRALWLARALGGAWLILAAGGGCSQAQLKQHKIEVNGGIVKKKLLEF